MRGPAAAERVLATGSVREGLHPSLAWVCVEDLSRSLDAATYLETTGGLRAAGWRVLLVCAGESRVRALRDVDVCCVPRAQTYVVGHLLWHWRALTLVARARPAVLLVHHDSIPYALVWRVLQRLRGRPRPLLVMDTRQLPLTRATWKTRIRAVFFRVAQWCANRFADGQTAITSRTAEAVRIPRACLLGVWPSGVSMRRFDGVAQQRRWPGREDLIEFVFIGALWRERHLLELAQAMADASRGGAPVRLTVIGDGPLRGELEAFATTTRGAVRVGAAVPYTEIPAALGAAHVGVSPLPDTTVFQVSSPIKVFEYLAAGLPVLATRIVCHTDVLGDAPFVFWAKEATPASLREAIEQACHERDRLPMLGALAHQAAGKFEWAVSATALDTALRRLLLTRREARA
jgi:glycosyltransferase involved in cell wall biosynthesis